MSQSSRGTSRRGRKVAALLTATAALLAAALVIYRQELVTQYYTARLQANPDFLSVLLENDAPASRSALRRHVETKAGKDQLLLAYLEPLHALQGFEGTLETVGRIPNRDAAFVWVQPEGVRKGWRDAKGEHFGRYDPENTPAFPWRAIQELLLEAGYHDHRLEKMPRYRFHVSPSRLTITVPER